jgi:Rps23 Pro-64 3,4-dihydroxylase Tpa1-like proline 4-hydroxylase
MNWTSLPEASLIFNDRRKNRQKKIVEKFVEKIVEKNRRHKIVEKLESMLWSQFSPIFAIFSAKNLAFFSKTNVMIKFLQKLAVVWAKKRQYFR